MDNDDYYAGRGLAMALVLAISGGCSPSVPDMSAPDASAPNDPGGNAGPTAAELTCPPLAMPPAAGMVFVDATASSGDGSLASPFSTVAQALASAGPGGVIYVAAGTYKESLTIATDNLTLYGGFATGFGSRSDGCATILEAPDPSQTVLVGAADVTRFTLDGVTVQNGARGLSVDLDGTVGATYSIASSVFAGNGTEAAAGGAMFLGNVNATISHTAFRDNKADKGAAIAHGGDNATITIEASVFERNIGYSDHGGALYLTPKSATISRNTFRGNEIGKGTGYGWGGAVIVYKAGAAPVSANFAYNVFTDNLAGVGAAVFIDDGASATMSHDLLYRNRAIRENGIARGAAIYVDGLDGPETGSHLVADHLTVANNNLGEDGLVSPSRGGGAYLETYSSATFTNSIFWNNGDDALFGIPMTSFTVGYSIVPSTCGATTACAIGTGVFEPADIGFVDEAGGDYHEKSTAGHFHAGTWVADGVTSPAVDAADPTAGATGEPAPNGARVNLGAFGGTAEASKSP